MKIVSICALNEVVRCVKLSNADAIISILDPETGTDFSVGSCAKHLTLKFHDVERITHGCIAPTIYHGREILEFVDALPADSRLLIHCTAGISRSPAVAIGLMARNGQNAEAITDLKKLARYALPNTRIVEIFAHLTNNRKLVADVRKQFETSTTDEFHW